MSNVLTHRFTSPKLDGPDATQVQPSAWNDGHRFVGGANGDVLTRDTTDATYGAKFAPIREVYAELSLSVPPGPVNDWALAIAGPALVYVSTTGLVQITGIKPTTPPYAGQHVRLILGAGAPAQLALYNDHPNSTIGSRIWTRPTTAVTVSGFLAFFDLVYSTLAGKWIVGALGDGQ